MLSLGDFVNGRSLGVGAALVILYLAGGAIYRLYFSPLAKFPGPKLAALTLWYYFFSEICLSQLNFAFLRYEFYFDVVQRGRYTWEIERMHQAYGT
jgi:hypothetical protein